MKLVKIAALGAVLAAIAAPAFAQQGGGPMTPEQREARFVAADANKDGKLDKAEWLTSVPEQMRERAEPMWGRLDADGDGSVTKEQYMALRMGPPPAQ